MSFENTTLVMEKKKSLLKVIKLNFLTTCKVRVSKLED